MGDVPDRRIGQGGEHRGEPMMAVVFLALVVLIVAAAFADLSRWQ